MIGTRFAVLADIHGNLAALEAVLEDMKQHAVDGILVAGDSVVGPGQNQVVRLLRSLNSLIIRGNGENYLLDYDTTLAGDRRDSRQWAPVRWSYRNLDHDLLEFLASLPEQRVITVPGTAPIRLVHGSPGNVIEPLFPNRDPERMLRFREAGFLIDGREPVLSSSVLNQIGEPVLACGHTHIPWVQVENVDRIGNPTRLPQNIEMIRFAFNPGSVGSPIDGDTRAQYALLTWDGNRWQAELKAVPYNLERVRADFAESGFLDQVGASARAILLGIETGQNVIYYLIVHAYRLAAEAGFKECAVVPDDIWERAVETLDWDMAASGKPLF